MYAEFIPVFCSSYWQTKQNNARYKWQWKSEEKPEPEFSAQAFCHQSGYNREKEWQGDYGQGQ